MINFFLGWTVIGWIVALSMAARSRINPTVVNVHSHGGNFVQPQYQPQQYPVQYRQQSTGGATAWTPQQMQPGQSAQPIQLNQQHPVIQQQGGGQPDAVPPGWHQDPYGKAAQRYWDGQNWTQHTS